MKSLSSLQYGQALWSTQNPAPITWIVVSTLLREGTMYLFLANASKARVDRPCNLEDGSLVKLSAAEVEDCMTDTFFKSATYQNNVCQVPGPAYVFDGKGGF
jgi:hypothetical protein